MLITTRLLSIAFHWRQILLQTLVVVDSESCRHSFFCTQPSEVRFKSEQTSFLRTGCQLRSAALHRIQFETFVPMSYFYSETDRWLKNWECQWALLWSATTSFQKNGLDKVQIFKFKLWFNLILKIEMKYFAMFYHCAWCTCNVLDAHAFIATAELSVTDCQNLVVSFCLLPYSDTRFMYAHPHLWVAQNKMLLQ